MDTIEAVTGAIKAIDAVTTTVSSPPPLQYLSQLPPSLKKASRGLINNPDTQSFALSSSLHTKAVDLVAFLCKNVDTESDDEISSLAFSSITTSTSILCNCFTALPPPLLSTYLNDSNSFFSPKWEVALMAIMCELKCGESKKRKMVARLIASIYNAMHSLQTDDINPAIFNNSNLIGNVIRMTLPTSSIKDSPSDSEPQDDCTDWSVRLLTYLLSPYDSPYPSIHSTLSASVITGEHVVLLNAFGGVVDEVLLSSGFRGSHRNDSTSNDATSNDATSNDATSNDATSNDATSNDPTSNDATSNDASPPPGGGGGGGHGGEWRVRRV
jgi:hypothetical protein